MTNRNLGSTNDVSINANAQSARRQSSTMIAGHTTTSDARGNASGHAVGQDMSLANAQTSNRQQFRSRN
ncbi:hypothetical protein HY623_01935 [Candidatus Uhrbacteria bacterium]|nr:hypothetical protein [Candidatus Uhrbacteria bacterium]